MSGKGCCGRSARKGDDSCIIILNFLYFISLRLFAYPVLLFDVGGTFVMMIAQDYRFLNSIMKRHTSCIYAYNVRNVCGW